MRPELLTAIRVTIASAVVGAMIVYGALMHLVLGRDGGSISYATLIYAQIEDGFLAELPGADQIAGLALARSFDLEDRGGCVHVLHANGAVEVGMPAAQRERLLSLIWSYASRGADLDQGCDALGAPPLWDAVLDLDEERAVLLMAAGADPDAAVVRTERNPLGLDLRGLLNLMRDTFAEDPAPLRRIDALEARLYPVTERADGDD